MLVSQTTNAEAPKASAFYVLRGHDIVIVGELHGNAAHHANQAEAVKVVVPKALVFEMLSPEQAEAAQDTSHTLKAELDAALGWSNTAWPNFGLYYPIFAAAPDARLYGATVAHDAMVAAMADGAASQFSDAAAYGLDQSLAPEEQAAREALQAEAHCNALPPDMLPGMVEAQRLRDASFARTALVALQETGGPVLVITGNGHARADWGMPRYLARAAPEVNVVSMGQVVGEDDLTPYDVRIVTGSYNPPDGDPCATFTKSN